MHRHVLLFLLVSLLVGCSSAAPAAVQEPRPTPTIAPFFSGSNQPKPTFDIPTAEPRATVITEDASQSILEATARPAAPGSRLETETIYDDGLAAGWTLDDSWDQRINPRSRAFAHTGLYSLEAAPLAPFGGLLLATTAANPAIYPRSEVVAVRFAVSGGVNHLAPYNLIVKILGSNRYPYFDFDDDSVSVPGSTRGGASGFPEIALDAFGMRRDLEPGEWAEIEVRLDRHDLVEYTYVTGIVVMNHSSYLENFYIDDVRLVFR